MRHLLRGLAAPVALSALLACSGAQTPADSRTTVVSLQKIDCAECGDEIVAELRKRPGVYEAKFDKRSAEIAVVASPSFDVLTSVKVLAANEGFEAMLGAGKGAYLPPAAFPAGADVVLVDKNGEDVPDLAPMLAPGKVTVVDFSAAWCEPCRKVDEHMAKLLETRKDVAYRKLEIGDWDTPLAQRYLKGASALPYVIVYGPSGTKVREIGGLDLPALDAAIQAGGAPK